jgi:hypothetical protein
MSITKNTQRRKKVASQKEKLSPKASSPKKSRPRFQEKFVEKYPDMGIVHEAEIRQFVSTVPMAQLPAYGARFHALMQALEEVRQTNSAQKRKAVARLLTSLEKESRNHRYRRVLNAMAAAGQSENGVSRAYWTALRVIEMTFEWSLEYMVAFGLYEQRLKASRTAASANPAAG